MQSFFDIIHLYEKEKETFIFLEYIYNQYIISILNNYYCNLLF